MLNFKIFTQLSVLPSEGYNNINENNGLFLWSIIENFVDEKLNESE